MTVRGSRDGVAELRTVEEMRFCSVCLVVNSPLSDFCTACGEPLPVPPVSAESISAVLDEVPTRSAGPPIRL
jgi:hypothetical protein